MQNCLSRHDSMIMKPTAASAPALPETPYGIGQGTELVSLPPKPLHLAPLECCRCLGNSRPYRLRANQCGNLCGGALGAQSAVVCAGCPCFGAVHMHILNNLTRRSRAACRRACACLIIHHMQRLQLLPLAHNACASHSLDGHLPWKGPSLWPQQLLRAHG